jgi:YD repeat-containing protein
MDQDPPNPPQTFHYNPLGRVTRIHDPGSTTATFTYDSDGRFTAGPGSGPSTSAKVGPCEPRAPEASVPPRPGTAPVLHRTFEFRLARSEAREQSAPLPAPAAGAFVVATNNLRAYLVRRDEPAEPVDAIGGIEVAAKILGEAVVVSARVSDLGGHEVVVIQVDVDVYRVGG